MRIFDWGPAQLFFPHCELKRLDSETVKKITIHECKAFKKHCFSPDLNTLSDKMKTDLLFYAEKKGS